MQFIFGAGDFFAVPLLDAAGNTISNPTPIRLGIMQEMSLEFSTDVKELHGQYQFAVDSAGGKGKVGGKVKGAQIVGAALSSLFFGQASTLGSMSAIYSDLVGAAIPTTPFIITVAPPSSGTYAEDLGVLDTNGVPYSRVASAPVTRQYSVNTGTGAYTFAVADAGVTVFINYRYSFTSVASRRMQIVNQQMGALPVIKALLHTSYKGKRALVMLPQATFTKLMMFGTKIDDYSVPEMDYSAYASSAGLIADIYVSE
jgi:hypothetical protein